jgi:hypothetical protein
MKLDEKFFIVGRWGNNTDTPLVHIFSFESREPVWEMNTKGGSVMSVDIGHLQSVLHVVAGCKTGHAMSPGKGGNLFYYAIDL